MQDSIFNISYIGLGAMGAPMAGHLARAGHTLTVYNRTSERASQWTERYGGKTAATPAQAASGADVVISCVGNDDDLAEVTLGSEGVFQAMQRGALFIDHTTVSARIARELSRKADHLGFDCIDAPVSGGELGAQQARLAIMCGGSPHAFARAESVMGVYAARMVHLGAAGAGQTSKMVNQIAIAGVLQGLSEALHFARRAQLDTDKVFEAISQGAAASWQMQNRWATMAAEEFDFGFAVDWMRKDLRLALDEARANGATLPVAALVDQFYADVQRTGGGRKDTSSLVQRLPK